MNANLDIIYAGPQPPNPAEMLMSEKLDKMMEELKTRYDYVIIDAVP
jgi:Mrp family chromosome partitioning ATPase